MAGDETLARRFETERGRLRAIAHRMLGSPDEADDAVQEAWLRLVRTGDDGIDNLSAWLTTIVSRICLDMLRAPSARREEPYGQQPPERGGGAGDPEDTALLGDSVGLALLVVLDRLGPAERVAFVLHDLFGVPFDRIAPVVGRSLPAAKKLASRARHKVCGTPAVSGAELDRHRGVVEAFLPAAKKLASRARHKVRGTPTVSGAELDRHRRVVEAFLAAARGGDVGALLDVLAPDVVRRADPAALPPGMAPELRGARAVAEGTVLLRDRSRHAAVALVDGRAGIVVAPGGRLLLALRVTVEGERILSYEVIADPGRLGRVEVAVLDPPRLSRTR